MFARRSNAALYAAILAPSDKVRVPPVHGDLSSRRLLTLGWLEGEKLLDFKDVRRGTVRNRLAEAMFEAWWLPMARYGVIHGDPHLGNYSVFRDEAGAPSGINLLDYGCIRIFPAQFASGVVELYRGFQREDQEQIVHAYELWGFERLDKELIDTLSIWARFIYAPLMEDRVRTVADGVAPGQYGRREAFQLHQALRQRGPVKVPREFVFMDRAAIGLGSVFLHLGAKLNFHRLFEALIADFSTETLAARQRAALADAGLVAS